VPDAADVFAREARSLVERLRVWTPQRWAASPGDAASSYKTRGDLVHHLAQSFVSAAGETDKRLPRLDSDLGLPDQLAVTADDLVRARPAVAAAAAAHLLVHRAELLAERLPEGFAVELGLADVVSTGRSECGRP
jgi:hypothetical protein